MAIGLPEELAHGGARVVRPRDLAQTYAQPWSEVKRLTENGVLKKIAYGYYALVPYNRLGDKRWRPDLESVALGLANADYGLASVALMGVSAARHHSAIPRALGVAVVAVPKQRPALRTEWGDLIFVKRAAAELARQRISTALGDGWVTSIEQTLLDLVARPSLGGLASADVETACRALASRADWRKVERLAADQHKPAALGRVERLRGSNA